MLGFAMQNLTNFDMFVLGYLSLNWINPHNIVHLLYRNFSGHTFIL